MYYHNYSVTFEIDDINTVERARFFALIVLYLYLVFSFGIN